MVKITRVAETRPGVCKMVADTLGKEIVDMYERSKERKKEMYIAFELTNDMEINYTDAEVGDEESIEMIDQLSLITEFYPYERTRNTGIIHTHPYEAGYVNMMLSPGDMNNHLRMTDQDKDYAISLITTRDKDGEIILFGIDSREYKGELGKSQDRIASLFRALEGDSGFTQYEIISEMADVMSDVGDWCYYKLQ